MFRLLQAPGSTPSVILPVPGVGRGRGQGGRGGPIRTFVPQGPSSAAAAVPAWMTKKASGASPSEETSTSTAANPFASSSAPPILADPLASSPAVFSPVVPDTDLSATPADTAADELVIQSTAESDLTAAPAVPSQNDDSAAKATPSLFTPAVDPNSDTPLGPLLTLMETQESTGQSPPDDAFAGGISNTTTGGGNGSASGGRLDDTFGNDPLADAFGGGHESTSDGLQDAFGGGGGGLDAFGGGNGGGSGLDDYGGSGLDDTFGGALAAGDIGQVIRSSSSS